MSKFPNRDYVARQRITELRKANHLTQRELAEEIDNSEALFSLKIRGLRRFQFGDYLRLADFFGVSLDYLTGRSDYAKPLEVS